MKIEIHEKKNELLEVDSMETQSIEDNDTDDNENNDILNLDDFEDADSGQGMWVTLIFNIRESFKKLRRSEVLLNKLESFCIASGIKYVKPLLDVKTRWNSTYAMLNVACRLKKGLVLMWDNCKELKPYKIEESGWNSLVKLLKILANFKHVSLILSSETVATLPSVVVTINLLLDNIEKIIKDLDELKNRTHADEVLLLAIQAGRDKILKHYTKTNWVYCVSLILDPRFKLEAFDLKDWSQKLKQESEDRFRNLLKTEYCSEEFTETDDSRKEIADELDEFSIDFNSLYVKEPKIKKQSWETELENYLKYPRANEKTNILHWWKENEKNFPRIAKMAKDVLSTMATSVPVERLFSAAGQIVTEKRCCLSNDSINALSCLNSWMHSSCKNEICKCLL